MPPEEILASVHEIGEVAVEERPVAVHGTWRTARKHMCKCAVCTQWRIDAIQRSKHGTAATYDFGCHCDDCKEAHRTKQQESRARARARVAAGGTYRHGSYGYRLGCQCGVCTGWRAEKTAREKARRQAKTAKQ